MPPKSASAVYSGCPLNEREIRVVVAALRHLTVKPTLDEKSMAEDLNFSNVRSAKNSFFRIMKKLGNDPVKIGTSEVSTSTKPATAKRSRKQTEDPDMDDEMSDAPASKRSHRMILSESILPYSDDDNDDDDDGGIPPTNPVSSPVPSIEECHETAKDHRKSSSKPAAKGKKKVKAVKYTSDEDDVDKGSIKLPSLARQNRRSKKAVSTKPKEKLHPYKQHKRFESAQKEIDAVMSGRYDTTTNSTISDRSDHGDDE